MSDTDSSLYGRRRISRRGFLRATVRTGIGAWTMGAGCAAWARKIQPGWVQTTHWELPLPRLDAAFDGLRIVHLTDIHADGWMNRARLEHVVTIANGLQGDVLALTGDYVTHFPERHATDLRDTFAGLKARVARVAVLGNHDQGENAAMVRTALREGGVTELRNNVLTLRRGGALLHLAGVDDPLFGQARMQRVLRRLPATGAAVLLAHEPDFADQYAPLGGFDLQLSGHSHGGQVVVPFREPMFRPSGCIKYTRGLCKVGDMLLYTNRGVGMSGPHVRFNCRPEIALVTLRAA